MTKAEIVNTITRSFHKANLQLRKHSPVILVAAGVVGTVASAVMACRATTKVSAIAAEAKETINTIHECTNNPEFADQYTEEDAKKDLTVVYAQTGLKFVKLYAPAVLLGAASISCMVASNVILHKRNVALAAAYTAVDKGFKAYRSRVVERFGKELDRELRHGVKAVEVEETVTDEDGKEQIVKKTVNICDPNQYSEYSRIFAEGCIGWEKSSEYNLTFLRHQQNSANNLLKERGYLFLNEVYDMLGFRRTKAGQVVGWYYDEKNPDLDNFVDFGIYNPNNDKAADFVNGYERNIVLDFNVNGPILDLI